MTLNTPSTGNSSKNFCLVELPYFTFTAKILHATTKSFNSNRFRVLSYLAKICSRELYQAILEPKNMLLIRKPKTAGLFYCDSSQFNYLLSFVTIIIIYVLPLNLLVLQHLKSVGPHLTHSE